MTKTAVEPTYDEAGDVIHYEYVVTNNSTTDDARGPGDGDGRQGGRHLSARRHPAARVRSPARPPTTVTQADLDAGSVVNTATAHAGGTDSNQAQATVPATQTPSLSLLKSITSGDPYAAVGAVVQYSYVVTNTGNVTVHGLAVADDNVGAVPDLRQGGAGAERVGDVHREPHGHAGRPRRGHDREQRDRHRGSTRATRP